MKMAALQLMQHKASKDSKLAALPENATAEAERQPASTPEASENTTETAAPTSVSPTSSESTQTPETAEHQQATPTENSAVTTNGTVSLGADENTGQESHNGGCDSPLEGKEALETIPGLAQAKELAESLAAEDGSGIGTSCEQLIMSCEKQEHTANGDAAGLSMCCIRLHILAVVFVCPCTIRCTSHFFCSAFGALLTPSGIKSASRLVRVLLFLFKAHLWKTQLKN